jgi:predicted transcriptional regulator
MRARKKIQASDFDACNQRFQRGLEVARALDAKAPMPHSTVIQVAARDVEEFFAAMTPKRFELLKLSKQASHSITDLAKATRRAPSAVSRDISKLASLGLVRVIETPNTGHGIKKIVQPIAAHVEIKADLLPAP